MRRRDPDAVMLRSAEANPHVTDHASVPGAEAPDLSTWNHPADIRAEALTPPLAVELPRRLTWPPWPLQNKPSQRSEERRSGSPTEAGGFLRAAPAPTEVGRRPSSSKSHEAADYKALLR
jgi:hypothetical protein